MSEEIVGNCWHCGHALTSLDLAREARCPGCAKAVHACRNCRLFAPGRANDCLEPIAERVADKERPNFCDYFEPQRRAAADSGQPSADALRRAAEALFKE